MDSAIFSARLGIAGLSLAAFSGTADLLHLVKEAMEIWNKFSDLDVEVDVLKTKLLLQKDILETWQRDWYSFTITGKSSLMRMRLLNQHDSTVQLTLRSVQSQLGTMDPSRILTDEKALGSPKKRLRWVAGQKEVAIRALENVESLLRGLYQILPLQAPAPDAGVMVALLSCSEDSSGAQAILQSPEMSQLVHRAFDLQKLDQRLQSDLDQRIKAFQSNIPGENMQISPPVLPVTVDEISAGCRGRGHYGGTPVIVEWKGYNASWSGQKGIELRGSVDNLSRMLHATPKPDEMLTLHCQGYYDDVQNSRYGFVFTSPAGPTGTILSLKQLLDKPTSETLPSLEQRYQAAYSLGLTISVLHSVGWLHKGIRSHNVLFVRRSHGIEWARPYLGGFEYSRPDKPGEISEKPAHSERFNVYRHPLAQGHPNEAYRKLFDVYSFGVILMEIGEWKAAFKRWKNDPTVFQKEIVDEISQKKLAHWMGGEYREAAVKCIKGDFGQSDASILKAFYVEVVEVLGRCLVNY